MRYTAFILAVLVIVGCGSEQNETPPEERLNALGTELTTAHCSRLLECCSEEDLLAAFQGIPVGSAEECQSSVEGIVQVNVLPRYEEAIEAGTVTFEEADVDACIEAVNRLACDEFQPDPRLALEEIPACRGLFEAQLATTEFCTDDFECKSGFCSLGADTGTCTEEPGLDEACPAERCKAQYYCTLEGVCAAQFPEDSACVTDAECLSGNCVDVDDTGDFRCRPLPPACGG